MNFHLDWRRIYFHELATNCLGQSNRQFERLIHSEVIKVKRSVWKCQCINVKCVEKRKCQFFSIFPKAIWLIFRLVSDINIEGIVQSTKLQKCHSLKFSVTKCNIFLLWFSFSRIVRHFHKIPQIDWNVVSSSFFIIFIIFAPKNYEA